MFKTARQIARNRFFAFIKHVANIDDTQQLFSNLLAQHNALPFPKELSGALPTPPYTDIGCTLASTPTRLRNDIVIATGRFRSGSTLLWNILREMPGFTAYYEPFNERRWFNRSQRGSRVDPTHRNVTNYWAEYDGLNFLDELYDEAWTRRHLYMTAETYAPAMQRYIETLIEHAAGRPVLQFNRVDFRLPWLRSRFPHAKFVHIFRHPREQWCSNLGDMARSTPYLTWKKFVGLDHFYLRNWAIDLGRSFPCLRFEPGDHPYKVYYKIWRLSHAFGSRYADISFSYEDLTADPIRVIGDLLTKLGIDGPVPPYLAKLVQSTQPMKWPIIWTEAGFKDLEREAERDLQDIFMAAGFRAHNAQNGR